MLGTVTAKSGNDLSVTLDGTTTTTPAVDCCGADTASRVVCALHGTQLLAVAVVGGGSGGIVAADYIVQTGAAGGWYYELYDSGYIHAWGEFAITWGTSNNWYLTIPTPATMANASYVPHAQISSWKVDQCYAGNRTTTQFQIATTASGGGDTGTVWVTLDGYVDGASIPQGRLADYTGAVNVTPSNTLQTLATQDTSVLDDITVQPVPYSTSVDPVSGGTIVEIG
jgi:hypothetical protein